MDDLITGECEDCGKIGPLTSSYACADALHNLKCCSKQVCKNGCIVFCPNRHSLCVIGMTWQRARCCLCNSIFELPNFKWYGNSMETMCSRLDEDIEENESIAYEPSLDDFDLFPDDIKIGVTL